MTIGITSATMMGGVSSSEQKQCKVRVQRFEETDVDDVPKYFKSYFFMGNTPTFCKVCDNGGLIVVSLSPYPNITAYPRTESITFSNIEETTEKDFNGVYSMCLEKINGYTLSD